VVSDEYKLVQHQEVINSVEYIIAQHPEWGVPTRTVYLSANGARKKVVWVFTDILYEIREGDSVHPTIEAFSSFDTTIAQYLTLGAFRLLCSNGLIIGKILAEYKRKHTSSLDLKVAANTISKGMTQYSNMVGLWSSYADRMALPTEFTLFEELPFHKTEKDRILSNMYKEGTVLQWDVVDGHKVRKAEINAWSMFNLMTYEATHNVNDIARQTRIFEGISKGFQH
jgi:hypothetical protein